MNNEQLIQRIKNRLNEIKLSMKEKENDQLSYIYLDGKYDELDYLHFQLTGEYYEGNIT